MLVGDSKLHTTLGGHSELGAAASTKAVWWDLRVASLLTHLFTSLIYLWLYAGDGARETFSDAFDVIVYVIVVVRSRVA